MLLELRPKRGLDAAAALDEVEMVAIEKAVTVAGLEPRPTATARHAKKAILATGLCNGAACMWMQYVMWN